MKKTFLKSWVKSVQPRKQRKFRHNAPLHIKRNFLSAHLSNELRKKYNTRSVIVRTGDKVKVMRGDFKGIEGKVEKVSVVYSKVYLSRVAYSKKDGSKINVPFEASNLMIVELGETKKRLNTEG